MIALRSGGWDAIQADWRVAINALQIIAEEGPGLLAAEAEAQENAAMRRLTRMVH